MKNDHQLTTPWWRARVTLSGLLVVLVGVGVVTSGLRQGGAATTTSTTSVTTTTQTGGSVTTTTAPPPPLGTATFSTPLRGVLGASHCPLTLAAPTASNLRRVSRLPRRCTVLEIGDSLGNDLGWGLARELGGYLWLHLVQDDVSSTGLTTPWFYNWPQHFAKDLAAVHPNLVVVLFGGNDQQGLVVDGRPQQFLSPGWRKGYDAIVRSMTLMARAHGAAVLWVGLPVMQQAGYSQGAHALNAIYASQLREVPDTAYLSTWSLLASPSGAFEAAADVNGSVQGLRAPDGIHFSFVGENVLATYVTTELGQLFHLPLRPAQPARIQGP